MPNNLSETIIIYDVMFHQSVESSGVYPGFHFLAATRCRHRRSMFGRRTFSVAGPARRGLELVTTISSWSVALMWTVFVMT